QSLSRSPEQAALTLGPDAVKLAGCNLQARDQPRPNQGRLKRGLGKAPVSGLLGSQNEILVGAADETDTRLAHIAERAQEAEGLKAIQRNGAWMSRIARDPFPRLHSRREGLGTVQDGGKIGEIRPGFDLGQPKASGTSVLSPREEQYHLFLNVGEHRMPERDDVDLRKGLPQVLPKRSRIGGMDQLGGQNQGEPASGPQKCRGVDDEVGP